MTLYKREEENKSAESTVYNILKKLTKMPDSDTKSKSEEEEGSVDIVHEIWGDFGR